MRDDFDRAFAVPNVLSDSPSGTPDGVDVLLHPSAIRTAPPLPSVCTQEAEQEQDTETNGLDSYVQDVLTVPASLAGLPALGVPAANGQDGWPFGVSIVGQWGCEEMVLRLGQIVERVVQRMEALNQP